MKKLLFVNMFFLMMITLIACGNKAPLNDSSESSTSESSIATNTNTSSTDEISDTIFQISSVETAETIETTDITVTAETADLTELVSFAESDLPVFSDDPDINHQYYEAILTLETTGILPDGTYCYSNSDRDFKSRKKTAYDNYIAVYDVNNDLQNELLIRIGGTSSCDAADYVFSYNPDGFFELLFDFYIGLEFYSDGIIYANVSHSQFIYNDDFWPYELYSYDQISKKYIKIASVEELDLNVCPECESLFSYEYDIDNDKKLYFVFYNGQRQYKDYIDYMLWRSSIIPSEKIDIHWFKL